MWSRPRRLQSSLVSLAAWYVAAIAAPWAFTAVVSHVASWPKPYSWQYLGITMTIAVLGDVAPGLLALCASFVAVVWLGIPTPVHPGAEMFLLTGVVLLALLERWRRTEQQLAATVDALRRSEAALDAFFEAAPGILNLLDDRLRFVNTDATTPTYFGLDRQGVRGRTLEEVAPEFAKQFGPMMRRVVATGEPQLGIEVTGGVPSRPGETAWVTASYFPVPLAGGSRGLGVIGVDITPMKRAEAAVRESTTLLRAISDDSEDAIFAKDLDGRLRFANPATLALLGKPLEEVLGRTDAELLADPTAARQVMENDRRIMESGVAAEIEESVPTPDGTTQVWLSRKSPYRDATGRVVGLLGISRDITRRKRAVQRATFLNEASRVLVSSRDYVPTLRTVTALAVPAIADCAAVYLLSEAGERECVAMSHVDPAGAALLASIAQADGPGRRGIAAVIRSGEAVLQRSFVCVPLIARGRTVGALTFAETRSRRQYDDTDLQFAEDVAYRAALAIDNARAYAETEAANRLKDEFLATLSHELRTPLNAILGYSRLLRLRTLPTERARNAIEAVERNATALTRIVEDVLDMSRIVSGKIRLDVQPVDVAAVVRNAIETILPAAEAKGIHLETVIGPEVGLLSGDPDRLQQVVWNLLSNAVKFTPGGGRVDVGVARVDAHIEITVTDTGMGIAPDFLPHVFERFRQADSGTKRARGGLGLGLAIVRQLAELHGGAVDALSAGLGTGATFIVRLPVGAAVSQRLCRSADRTAGAPALPLTDIRGVRVLAVDDDAEALSMVREILKAAGADVAVAESGPAALDAVAEFRPDVLIADIGMPAMDGLDLIEQIRHSDDAEIRDVPAAAVTAFARSEDRVRCLQRGFQMHLAKPVDPVELVTATASLARRR